MKTLLRRMTNSADGYDTLPVRVATGVILTVKRSYPLISAKA